MRFLPVYIIRQPSSASRNLRSISVAIWVAPAWLEPRASVPADGLPVFFDMNLDLASAYRSLERGVIPFGLVGVGDRELAHRVVECIAGSDIAADQPRMAGATMRTGQRPAAQLAIDFQQTSIERLDQGFDLRVAQLTHIELTAFEAGRPAEEDVRG